MIYVCPQCYDRDEPPEYLCRCRKREIAKLERQRDMLNHGGAVLTSPLFGILVSAGVVWFIVEACRFVWNWFKQ